MTTVRCNEVEDQIAEMRQHMLTKGDIPTIASTTAEIVRQQALAQVGTSTLKTLWFILVAISTVVGGWLAAHGYIDGGSK